MRMIGALLLVAALAACGSEKAAEAFFEPENAASDMRARLMTGEQYTAAVAYVFGEDVAASVVAPMPPTARIGGLTASGAAGVGVSPDQLQQVQISAALIAAKVVDEEHRTYLIPCEPENPYASDDECARAFLSSAGRLWFRRPLSETSLDRYVEAAAYGADMLEDFYDGLALALEGMLASPEALYIIDGADVGLGEAEIVPLDAYSLASRLSFFLWNAPPDDGLLNAAQSGALSDPVQRAAIVDRMIESPRLEEGMRAFFDDMLHFDEFDTLAKDPSVYPALTGQTLADAREQTLRTIMHELIVEEGDYRDLFTTRDTFMSLDLAPVYGTPAKKGWHPHTFPEDGLRRGIISHVSFLAAHAHPARSSATLRGKEMRDIFLCQVVPDPPPNVDFSNLEEPDPSIKTARGRLRIHNENPSCAGCHKLMDPVGLAMENFDGGGQFRETEDGAELDTSGDLDGVTYTDMRGLAEALRNHPSLPGCFVERLYAYATGGPMGGRRDWPVTEYLEAEFTDSDYRLKALLKTIAMSDAFSRVRNPVKPADAVVASLAD
ncbi:DUF1592 domain-containing protein [Parvularcula sp. ZS-1/3]|uniref:DUF1592 domain-containing protein n=2 Tax=Parvularcula mediterranea TaxID=2732508 RepID=A0A7Y3RLE0_9PROT|nr:DUF1592 domain-containing protein [Parvularcula mediterranea]